MQISRADAEIVTNKLPLINKYKLQRQSHIYYWQYFEHMLKQAHDVNNNIICLGDMNTNFLGNPPQNVNDILVIND